MLRYKIMHRTYYNYSANVMLGSHNLLLRPREDYELRIETFSLKIIPDATLLWHRDVEGNSVAIANFTLPTNQLVIESEVIIQQYNESPLNFMVSDYALRYPFSYQGEDNILLSAYKALPDPMTTDVINKWINNFWQVGETIQTYTLLQRIAEYIHKTLTYRVREEPGVQSAIETLRCGTGSCRDFAFLFMQAVRCLGLASRFVSGYLYAPLIAEIGSTHAWAEVYLPGAGWKGFDPTIGKIVGSDHIAVAVARLPESVPPIAGSFAGAAVSSLTVGVWVSLC
ncbi:MAG: transglutaminase family protein [Sulfuricurvum sp.]|uniref:transglutaminase family protein n=1 Tax=Sulfuricurvum sp. TaxID=2025608 RepID=UPI00260FA123|nr:transglutaminase family protein [Sulfuricurvum sp.]MDD2368255.1 transglutaminase family protein [Sulfuricurvum sp.]MDD2951008.1 transglutaminase family protein [Sulfuricurvum sp.]MDD5117381.1 transglutaminase family protein [Sulfuricurvum sp.]